MSLESRLALALSGVVIPLVRLKAALDVDQLSLREELAANFRQAVPRHAGVVLRPLTAPAAELVRGDRERLQHPRLH